MALESLGPNGGYAVLGLIIAGITFAVEKYFEPLGKLGKLLYGVAAILVIVWAITLILTVV